MIPSGNKFSACDDSLQNTNSLIITIFFKNLKATIFWIAVVRLISNKVLFITICAFFGLQHEVWIYGIISGDAIIIFQSLCSLLEVGF